MSTARVDFTRGAAERIANVVRKVEQGSRDQEPLSFREALVDSGERVKIIDFTGSWGKTQHKTVTVSPGTSTIAAINLFATIFGGSCTRKGAIARSGGVWYLISAEGD
jgi:hypothetical protein